MEDEGEVEKSLKAEGEFEDEPEDNGEESIRKMK